MALLCDFSSVSTASNNSRVLRFTCDNYCSRSIGAGYASITAAAFLQLVPFHARKISLLIVSAVKGRSWSVPKKLSELNRSKLVQHASLLVACPSSLSNRGGQSQTTRYATKGIMRATNTRPRDKTHCRCDRPRAQPCKTTAERTRSSMRREKVLDTTTGTTLQPHACIELQHCRAKTAKHRTPYPDEHLHAAGVPRASRSTI